MKKVIFSLCFAFMLSCSSSSSEKGDDNKHEEGNEGSTLSCKEADGPVACYGSLKVNGNKLTGSKTGSRALQLRGVSLGWSNTSWESAAFFTTRTVDAMVDDWKAEIIRVPMGHGISGGDGYSGSYTSSSANKTANMNRVKTAIDAALAKGIYVIIDWHSHGAHKDVANSKEFFNEMAEAYGSYDNVIFEIYNEPSCDNGTNTCDVSARTTWAQIKAYSEEIIPVIRAHSQNLILVGTRDWSRHVEDVIGNEPSCEGCNNLAYVLHFYAQNHTIDRHVAQQEDPSFREVITQAMNAGLYVFISEYGTTNSDGGNPSNGNLESHSTESTNTWHAFMDEKKISSCAWHVNNKNEGSSYFISSFSPSADSYADENNMTLSGKYIFNKLRTYAEAEEWRGK